MSTLNDTAELLRVLGEPTRLRLALLLGELRLSVAELTELTGLAQSRISSHLARMRRLGLIAEERHGSTSLQGLAESLPWPAAQVLATLREGAAADELAHDLELARALVARREQREGWAARVAGEMEKHYSPGRGWEVLAHALRPWARLGDTLDIAAGDGVVAGFLAPQARSLTCVDLDATVAAAGQQRLRGRGLDNARYLRADMHALPFAPRVFDTVLLLNALPYSDDAPRALAEAARVLRPGGTLLLGTLDAHSHAASVAAYDHRNQGFGLDTLRALVASTGLALAGEPALVTELRPPYHRVHVLLARHAN